jgi:hypothetical protein
VSDFLFLAWWLFIPVMIGVFALRLLGRRSGVIAWLGVVVLVATLLTLNSAMQTLGTCGLTLAEMRADLSSNCTYATNSIHETFVAHLVITSAIAAVSFIAAHFVLAGKRGSTT